MTIRHLTTFAALLLAACFAGAQEKTVPVVKKVPMKQTSPVSGKQVFAAYCAACTGKAKATARQRPLGKRLPPT